LGENTISINAMFLTQRSRLVRHSWSKGVSDGGRGAEEDDNLGEGTIPLKAVKADLPRRTQRDAEEGKYPGGKSNPYNGDSVFNNDTESIQKLLYQGLPSLSTGSTQAHGYLVIKAEHWTWDGGLCLFHPYPLHPLYPCE